MLDKASIDFSTGPIAKKIIAYTVPLFFGNLFQQLYNAADTVIVGNFIGPDALAALSSSGALIFMMVGFFNGLAAGAGVVISSAFGAKDSNRLERAIHSDLAFGIVAGALLTIVAVVGTPLILRWISTPEDLLPISQEYFRIYSAGIFFSVMYNILMGIMNALGDSRHPLYYLIISSLINIVLDLFFIAVLGMGVGSAAFATIFSQAVSCVLCFLNLRKSGVSLKGFCVDLQSLKAILRYGLPSGLQNSILGLANTVVQASVNTFPSFTIAAFGVYAKIEGFVLLPITSFAISLTTFVAQVKGAGDIKRVKQGARIGLLMDIAIAEIVGIALFLFAPLVVSLFTSDSMVIEYGAKQARIEALLYFMVAFSHGCAGVLRGDGKAYIPMLVILSAWCVARVIYISIVLPLVHDIGVIYSAYPITWLISTMIFIPYIVRFFRQKERL